MNEERPWVKVGNCPACDGLVLETGPLCNCSALDRANAKRLEIISAKLDIITDILSDNLRWHEETGR